MEGKIIETRFGIKAVEKGFITPEQLIEALRIQVMGDVERKQHKLIGTILLEMGLMTSEQIEEVVRELTKKSVT
jgi:hypothetical protein